MFLFETPLKAVKVRKNVHAYIMKGCILIKDTNLGTEQKYLGYSLTESIQMYRKKFPFRTKK